MAPHHPNGIQLSRDRFLVLYGTLDFRTLDGARSIIYQLRADSYDGPLLREGFLSRARTDWDPLGIGVTWYRHTRHPVAFGVPKGAVLDGSRQAHENVFLARWRVCASEYDPATGSVALPVIKRDKVDLRQTELLMRTHQLCGVQFRLNDADDDIELLQPEYTLHQTGYESGEHHCAIPFSSINAGYAQAWPLNADASEWVDLIHGQEALEMSAMGVAAVRWRFKPGSGLYEWTETGPLLGAERGEFEGSVTPYRDGWLVAARRRDGCGFSWYRMDSPFARDPTYVHARSPNTVGTPITVYTCADGTLRLFTGDSSLYPHAGDTPEWVKSRNPLYAWSIDPDRGFTASDRHLVFDTVKDGVRIREEHWPVCDYGKLLPHAGGSEQILLHRVRPSTARSREAGAGTAAGDRVYALTDDSLADAGIYMAKIRYTQPQPPTWTFG